MLKNIGIYFEGRKYVNFKILFNTFVLNVETQDYYSLEVLANMRQWHI